jgi:hypothetical protein
MANREQLWNAVLLLRAQDVDRIGTIRGWLPDAETRAWDLPTAVAGELAPALRRLVGEGGRS